MRTQLSRILILEIAFKVIISFIPETALASSLPADSSAALTTPLFSLEKPDKRVRQLRLFLAFYKSPLEQYAADFVSLADKYGLDWKLVPSITGAESTFGKFIPYGSYNAYGWANGEYRFQNWSESIEIVTKTLKERYINRGADTVEKIAPIYAPPSKTWARNVRYFMDKLENFEPQPEDPHPLTLSL